ncbi:MAG TPA: hypothetical protein VGM92_04405 [Candidatus Kapabacteria bacterium]
MFNLFSLNGMELKTRSSQIATLSDGQTWDRIPINAPSLSGAYHITVTVGAYSTTLGYTVF